MTIIFHITTQALWDDAQARGVYRVPSLDTEGFIHTSRPDQVVATANRIFKGNRDLVLLMIDRASVGPKVVDENTEGGDELFPHIYGELNLDAVTTVVGFPPGVDGSFVMPDELRGYA